MNEDKVFIEGHVVGLFADALGRKGKQIKVASGDIVDIDDDFIYKSIGPETGHAEEAPRYLKNILARLRELPEHDREVWLKAIMGEFEQDFSRSKWRDGYEQGKVEGMVEREKVKVKQFVADWIEHCRGLGYSLYQSMELVHENAEIKKWFIFVDNQDLFARAWLDGYEVEEEKRYTVKIKGEVKENKLVYGLGVERYFFANSYDSSKRGKHTRKQLEEADFGWVFDCPGIEIEEVE